MATAVCETSLHSHVHSSKPQQSRYRWPSLSSIRSSSSSKTKPSALRVVSSETPPTPTQKASVASADPSAPEPGVRVSSSDHLSRDASSATANVAEALREQARLPDSPPSSSKAKSHVRAKSTTAVGEPSRLDSSSARTTAPSQFPPQPRPRVRAASSATMNAASNARARAHARPRLPSMLSSVLTNPRAPVQTQLASTGDSGLVGSFAPTGSPRPRLLSLLSFGGTAPSPTPSAPQSPSRAPLYLATDRLERRLWSASSPVESPATTIPSICRTPSSDSGSEYFPTAPSSAGPTTPTHTVSTLPFARMSELHPVLESLERTSMFSVQTACATCGKHGSNFPCCPKCGEMWCSRACRLQKGNGKRHICAKSG
ncbi:hypothetical protein C8Q73DRAFT_700104 [Cubamyces lactineus]|nr:hypothetical protein C8Q73DRAFT_700104 [Cubamyces lactineus]